MVNKAFKSSRSPESTGEAQSSTRTREWNG